MRTMPVDVYRYEPGEMDSWVGCIEMLQADFDRFEREADKDGALRAGYFFSGHMRAELGLSANDRIKLVASK